MKATVKNLGIDRLSVEDCMRLMEEVWDSIDAQSLRVPQWHQEELDRGWRRIKIIR